MTAASLVALMLLVGVIGIFVRPGQPWRLDDLVIALLLVGAVVLMGTGVI
jgi:hypothetical protein